jgi:hypothetical protein
MTLSLPSAVLTDTCQLCCSHRHIPAMQRLRVPVKRRIALNFQSRTGCQSQELMEQLNVAAVLGYAARVAEMPPSHATNVMLGQGESEARTADVKRCQRPLVCLPVARVKVTLPVRL